MKKSAVEILRTADLENILLEKIPAIDSGVEYPLTQENKHEEE